LLSLCRRSTRTRPIRPAAFQVRYREEAGPGTAVTDTPEMERVRRNQQNISSVRTRTHSRTHAQELRSNIQRLSVKYKQSPAKATSVGVTPELERVRQNQDNISSVKYQRGLQEVRGRSCTELDTPEYRRVRKTQDSVSMVAAWLPWLTAAATVGGANLSGVARRVGLSHGD
uniref:Uncharacterized protein n=1 Tax=Scophthalmus maximus TaxID=52904 RepID=A0A8D3A7C7_SCOMX